MSRLKQIKCSYESISRFKDGVEIIGEGLDGHLTLTALQLSDSGLYYCQIITAAGVTLSEKASLQIKGIYFSAKGRLFGNKSIFQKSSLHNNIILSG